MKKILAAAALSAAISPAFAMNGGDWADVISIVVPAIAGAIVAANQPPPVPVVVEAPPAPVYVAPPPIPITSSSFIDQNGNRACVYTDGSVYAIPRHLECEFYKWQAKQQYEWEQGYGR